MFSASSGTLSRSEPPRSVKKKVTFKRTGFDEFVKIGITDFLSRYRYATTTAPSHYPIANATHRRNKLIMDVILKWCKDRNIFEIRLDVYQDNPSAIRAYEKAGMKKHLIMMRMNLND